MCTNGGCTWARAVERDAEVADERAVEPHAQRQREPRAKHVHLRERIHPVSSYRGQVAREAAVAQILAQAIREKLECNDPTFFHRKTAMRKQTCTRACVATMVGVAAMILGCGGGATFVTSASTQR